MASSSSTLSSRLSSWARDEMGFVPKRSEEDPFKSVTAGPLAAKWAYLIDHVRSEENVAKIRGNLFLLNKRKRELARHEGEVATEPALVEKAELMHEISRAQAHLRSCREKTQAAASALEQDIEDCKTREKTVRFERLLSSETCRLGYLLQLFSSKTELDARLISNLSGELTEVSVKELFRRNSDERIYTDEREKRIRTAAEHAVEQSLRSAQEVLLCGGEDEKIAFHNLVKDLFGGVGTSEAVAALYQEAVALHAELEEEVTATNPTEAAQALRYNLEASGRLVSFSNPSGKLRSTYQVLTELCRRHVAVRSEAETEKKAADEIEERIRQKMESFSQQLEQDIPEKYTRDLMLHQLALEMTRDRGEAMVTSLQKGLTIGQKTMAKHSDGIKREMEHLRGQIERQSREMAQKVSFGETLISDCRHHFKSGDFSELQSSSQRLISEELIPLVERVQTLICEQLPGKVSAQLAATASVRNFSALKSTEIGGGDGKPPVRHQTSSLSIYRLSGNANMVDKDDQDDNLSLSEHFLRDFQLFDQVSPLCLIQKILDRKRERSNLDRILAGGTDRERRTEELRECCQKAKNFHEDLEASNKKETNELLPQLDEVATRVDKGKKLNENLSEAVRIWVEEPAQETISTNSSLTVNDLTLRKWQDKYRVALARWQQLEEEAKQGS